MDIEGQLYPFHQVAKLDGRTWLKFKELLNQGKGQQKQSLAIYFLFLQDPNKGRTAGAGEEACHIRDTPLDGVGVQANVRNVVLWLLLLLLLLHACQR